MTFSTNRLSLCAIVPALTLTAFGQNLFSNGSFETGTFASSPANFAGQNASVVSSSGSGSGSSGTWSIDNWSFSPVYNNGLRERWMNDSDDTVQAADGNRYVFLSTSRAYTSSSQIARLSYTGGYTFQAGITYTFSFSAADAGSWDGANDIKPLVGIQIGNVGSFVYSSFQYVNVNSAWSDSSESTIPWQTYEFTWTPSQTYNNVPFYLAASQNLDEDKKGYGAVVIDNFSATAPVPEAETVAAGIFAAGLAGAGWYRSRRRAAAKA
jgi:hypothetical protein